MAMPTNSATQSISFLQLQTEFGGANPISISEYYRGGLPASAGIARVPSSYIAHTQAWVEYTYSSGVDSVNQTDGGQYGAIEVWYFNSSAVYTGAGTSSSRTVGSTYYQRGTYQTVVNTPADSKTGTAAFNTYYWAIQRWEAVATTYTANASVPASGTISMSQFYGTSDYT